MDRRRRNREKENRERRKRLIIASVAVVCLIFGSAFLLVKLFSPSGERVNTASGENALSQNASQGEQVTQTVPFQSYGTQEESEDVTTRENRVTGAVTDAAPATASTDTADEDASAGGTSDPDDEGSLLENMSLEEKVAQLFFITPEALTGYQQVTQCGNTTYAALKEYPVGGLIYFTGNLETPDQTRDMIGKAKEYMRRETGIPLFTGVDEEGGRVVRVAENNAFNVTRFRPMGEIAASGNADEIYNAGNAIGAYLNDLGFNIDFAPVADVITNPANTAIGDRSFGNDKDRVAEMAKAFTQGLSANDVLAVYKHFPGHGGTEADTHEGYAYSMRTKEELLENELVPFRKAIDEGIGMIMTAHISLPALTGNDIPATLSEEIVTDLLRDEMGFEGVIITDALNMGAIANTYTAGESAVYALQAGCDMLLMPSDFKTAYRAVLAAVRDGTLSETRIDRSVTRILELKKTIRE